MLVKGRTEEALKLCKNIAQVNGKQVSEEELNLEDIEVGQRLGDIRDLFATRNFRKRIFIMGYCW